MIHSYVHSFSCSQSDIRIFTYQLRQKQNSKNRYAHHIFRAAFIPYDPPAKQHFFAWLCMKYAAHSLFERIPARVDKVVRPWKSREAFDILPLYVHSPGMERVRNLSDMFDDVALDWFDAYSMMCVVLYWNGFVWGYVGVFISL